MDLTNAYANEVTIFTAAAATWLLIVWMIADKRADYNDAVVRGAPPAWIITGEGGLKAEWWRLFQVTLLLWIAWWMMTHPPPSTAEDFFDPAQFNPGRNTIALLVLTKVGSTVTDRWYRLKAKNADIRGLRQ